MSSQRENELLERAALALSGSRKMRERATALQNQSVNGRELRGLLRSAKNVEAELENALLTSSAPDRAEAQDALAEARNLRIAIEELLEQVTTTP